MRSAIKFALLFLLWTPVAAPVATAQSGVDYGDVVLMSPEQGQALADFALQSGPRVRPKPDCSHLVHLLYARAGLIYPYEDSRVLYRGVDDFERVKTPQPGDLVVWLGHVGIVLSPEEKTFLSSVRSGIITESWTASQWARRRPRFFRYRIGPAANTTLLASIMNDDERPQPELRAGKAGTAAQVPYGPPEPDALEKRAPDSIASPSEPDATAPQHAHQNSIPDAPAVDSSAIVAAIHQRAVPNKREIVAAIIESSNARAQRLIAGTTLAGTTTGGQTVAGEMLDLERPLSVFDRIEVLRIKVKHESGWVSLRLNETMAQELGKVVAARTMERELPIRRRKDGVWIITDPRDRTYLPQAQAVSAFERQAEIFLRRAPNSSGTRMVVKALDRLYDQQPGAPQRAALK
jgi:NlpC/P60 family